MPPTQGELLFIVCSLHYLFQFHNRMVFILLFRNLGFSKFIICLCKHLNSELNLH